MVTLVLILVVVGAGAYLLSSSGNSRKQVEQNQLDDALADAKRWTDRLGSQVLNLSGNDAASTQAMADASERFNAASSALSTAQTVKQAQLARESALEGLYYVNAAREIMGLPAGPQLPELEGQRRAGRVTEERTVRQEDGTTVTASPHATPATPHYYPGGAVAGRPVPAGWYSSAWWGPAMMTGVWAASSMMFYSAMFAGMAGTPPAAEFEAGDFGGDGSGDAFEAYPSDASEDVGAGGDGSLFQDSGSGGDGGGDAGGGDDGGGLFDGLFGDDGFDFGDFGD